MIIHFFSISSDRLEQYAVWSEQLFNKYSKERFYTKYSNESNPGGVLHTAYSTLRQKGHDLKDIVQVQRVKQRKRKNAGIEILYLKKNCQTVFHAFNIQH